MIILGADEDYPNQIEPISYRPKKKLFDKASNHPFRRVQSRLTLGFRSFRSRRLLGKPLKGSYFQPFGLETKNILQKPRKNPRCPVRQYIDN
jgi:hypothetical protein